MNKLDEEDFKTIYNILCAYKELSNSIEDLKLQLEKITQEKQKAEEKYKLLEQTETDFLKFLNEKYNNVFTTSELYKIISEHESSNMCNS